MSKYFVSSLETQTGPRKEKTHSFLFYFTLFDILVLFIFGTFISYVERPANNYDFQVMLNWTIVFGIFIILIIIFMSHYSFKKYVTQSPQEWIDNFDNSNSIVPTKFQSFFGRTFLIDKDQFTLLSNTDGYICAMFIMMFLTIGIFAGAIPYYLSPDFQKYTDTADYPKPFAFFFILILIQIGFWIKYKNENRWSFKRISSNQFSFSITNDAQQQITSQTDNQNISNFSIECVTLKKLYPTTRINRMFSTIKQTWVLFIILPPYLKPSGHQNREYFLFHDPSKEHIELLNKVFLKWVNNIDLNPNS